jgi:hypothetical protein
MSPGYNIIQFKAEAHEISFVVTKDFERDSKKIFTMEERTGFLNYLAANPDSGVRIKGGRGLRKMRWKAKGFGKRGGARIIYYFRDLNMPLLLLAIYAKNERAMLSKSEIKAVEQKVSLLVQRLTTNWASDRRKSSA